MLKMNTVCYVALTDDILFNKPVTSVKLKMLCISHISFLAVIKISIGLPGGLYLTTHPSYESENILVFSDKEQTFYIEVQAEENDDSLENSLRNEMQQNRYTVLTDITPMSLNELNGCYAIYANSENEYYDARIQNPQAAK